MSRTTFVNWLFAFATVWLCGCAPSVGPTYSITPKYKIDGDFLDWKTFETSWTETGLDWSKINVDPPFDGFDLKELHYDNDGAYLYLFVKCKPSVQERYDKRHSAGSLGSIYIDSDSDTNTGATGRDASGMATVPGADIEIPLLVGIYMSTGGCRKDQSGCYVSYEVKLWDSAKNSFSSGTHEASSRSEVPLIAHGTDGVELAIPLADLNKARGDSFDLICWETGPRDYASKVTVRLK
ncbi:MAG: hypothetical protein HY298_01835 [Verrucomicrobia bacterium]|nr:hypothetical protein [Verrucomicrobiota bacterium]